MAETAKWIVSAGDGGRTCGTAVADWLARSQRAPELAAREWTETGVALLPLGRRFDAARLPQALVQVAVGVTVPHETAVRVARLLDGPVIYDDRAMGGTYYALMRPPGFRTWEHQAVAPCLSHGTFLGVPRLDRVEPPGTYWVAPPKFAGDLCEPATVAAVVRSGSRPDEEVRP
ncbi:hypothetical protein [Streptomyces flavofungini]|uniref:hypothetical protein n=1 Tax=Streptomyces flavofungini TaxID=68200 RepID=UPI0034DF2EAA